MKARKVIRVSDVMQQRYLMIHGMKTVKEALEALMREDVDTLIVEKRDEDDEFGIVLLADIAKKVLARDRSPERVNVYEVMSKPVVSVQPSMNVRYCARMFDQFGLSIAPVISKGVVQGMVDYRALVLDGLLKQYE